jgi:COX assembly protein 1
MVEANPIPVGEKVERLPMPSKNPLPLSSSQEAAVRELYHARVRGYCAAEIKGMFFSFLSLAYSYFIISLATAKCKRSCINIGQTDFADCALGRTFSAPFVCRPQLRLMNKCMISHATQAEQDTAREEWFALRLQRQKDREVKEERRKEQEKFHREWWGLPVDEREGEKGRDVMRQAERVGGFPKSDEGQLSKDRHR